jgi:hypothetical protein
MTRFLLLGATFLVGVTAASAQQPAQAPAPAIAGRPAARAAAAGATARAATPISAPTVLPGTRESAFSVIQGNALDWANSSLPNTTVRLRNARLGRIAATQKTDSSGMFTFRSVDPGNYVVELMGSDQIVLAASQLLSANAGEAESAIVKLPFQLPALGGLLGQTIPQATTVTSAAAATGVLNAAATSDVSPDGTN